MQLHFHNLLNPSLFVPTPTVGRTDLIWNAAYEAELSKKFGVLNEQHLTFAWIFQLGQNRVPYTWQLNTGPICCDNQICDLHLHFCVAQTTVQYGLQSHQNIKMSIIDCNRDSGQVYTLPLTDHGDNFQLDCQIQ